jgi:phage N-6-adenine-methyltransferase
MSWHLPGFRARNHPQVTAVAGVDDTIDERITPHVLYRQFDYRFAFTLDAAANEANKKTPAFYSLERDGLDDPWAPHSVWCNPPYSNIGPWLEKSHREFAAGCKAIVLLLPANRTEQAWWQQWVEPYRDRGGPLRTEFVAKRWNFGTPANQQARYRSSAPFGLAAVMFSTRHVDESVPAPGTAAG